MFYNGKASIIPKNSVARCKSEAQLESFMKEIFEVPSTKSVKLTFRTTSNKQKHIFFEDYFVEQLSMAIAVYMDDASLMGTFLRKFP